MNQFEKEEFNPSDEKNISILDDLKLSIDGSIVAVRKQKVRQYLDDKEVFLVRMGRQKLQNKIEVKTEDDFWKLLSYFVDLDEGI